MLSAFPKDLPSLKDSAPFLVIGSGIAGLYAALELSKLGPVILITKSNLSESNTTYAQGGIAAAQHGNVVDLRSFCHESGVIARRGDCSARR